MTTLSSPAVLTRDSLDALKARLTGDVLLPGDPDYDTRRQGWNLSVEQRPAVVVVPRSAADVAEAVRFAAAEGLGVGVMGTGHGTLRAADDAMLINTSQMSDVRVNPDAQTAWVEAGVEWGKVLEQAQAVGLAPLLGSSPNVGAVGYTLGGGLGWLARQYGFSADSVHFYEIVTPDGKIRRASPTENEDLFWGLHGGGSNFGVVTGMEIQLYPVTTIYGGNIMYPASAAREVFNRYRRWIANAPDELTSSVSIFNFPPLPMVPEPLRGKSFVIVRAAYNGPAAEAVPLFEVWNRWGEPMVNTFRAMPFADVASISEDPLEPVASVANGGWLADLSEETIDMLLGVALAKDGPLPVVFAEVRHIGGVVARGERHVGAIGRHDAPFLLNLIGVAPVPETHPVVAGYLEQIVRALGDHMTGGVYLNFVDGDKARLQARSAYQPGAWERLIALKQRYDPQDVFRFSYHIPLTA